MTKMVHLALSFIFFTFFLIGCSTLSSSDSSCMKTVLVSTLSRISLHPVNSEDTRSISISTFKAGCGGSCADLPGGPGTIGINMKLTMPEATRGKGMTQKIALPFFIALLDDKENVLDRRDEVIEIKISKDSLNHTYKTSYRPPAGIEVSSQNHRVMVGFNGDAWVVKKASHSKGSHKH